jgi:DNA primase
LRPLLGAPASCPLAWSEVTARLNPARFTMAPVPKRFDKMPGPLVPVLTGRRPYPDRDRVAFARRILGATDTHFSPQASAFAHNAG